jgi:pimeloyl-ACP methyl ester carboxylesterase
MAEQLSTVLERPANIVQWTTAIAVMDFHCSRGDHQKRGDAVMTNSQARYAESADGTRLAYRCVGSRRPVVIVGGALATAEAGAPLAAALADAGLQGVTYDRRGRGDSGDTAPYAPEREAEDLGAVIDAVGDDAVVFGHSSGAVLALFAASMGVPVTHLFLSEPPLRFGQNEPPANLPERLQALVDQDRNEDAVLLFLREDVGLPEVAIEGLRATEEFAGLVALAQTAVYDHRLVASVSTPTASMIGVDLPTTILRGDPTMPVLVTAVERLAEAMSGADLVVVPESHDHGVDPMGTVREIRARIG